MRIAKAKSKTAALILAAGLSVRMNRPKPWLKFDASRTFLLKIIEEFSSFGCGEIIVVLNEENTSGVWKQDAECLPARVKVCINPRPESGRFLSLKTGLGQLNHLHDCFIHNVDNPFVNRQTLSKMIRQRSSDVYVSPVYKGRGGHPVLIGGSIIGKIRGSAETHGNLREVLKQYLCRRVEVNDPSVLININTPEAYDKYFQSPGT